MWSATLTPAVSEISLDPLRFAVEHGDPVRGAGPSLRVYAPARELLRFDCFEQGGRWRIDPGGRDLAVPFESGDDPLEWTLAELRRDLEGHVARAGFALEAPFEPGRRAAALELVERALRNPPLDLGGVQPAYMDFPIAEPIRRALRRAVEDSDLGYPIHPAPTDVPEIVVARMQQRFGWCPDVGCVEILTDVVQGMYVGLQQFSEPGDGVVVQTPIYPPFIASVRAMKRRLIENPLALGRVGYGFDLDGLHRAAADGARILFLCNPHNPSGRVFRRQELEDIAEIVTSSELVVVSDEIHADLVYSGHRHVPFSSLSSDVAARTITLSAASKAFNVAGLRCAVAIFGAPELKRRFCALPRHLRGGIGVLGIEALRAAWRHGQPWLDQVLAYLEDNRDLLAGFLVDEFAGIRWHPPEATYLGWLDCRDLGLEPDPCSLPLLPGAGACGPLGRCGFRRARPRLRSRQLRYFAGDSIRGARAHGEGVTRPPLTPAKGGVSARVQAVRSLHGRGFFAAQRR
jgi:cystathionine beta-lyase